MIKVILWDVDGTLLDFKKAEYAAIRKCFDSIIMKYSIKICGIELKRHSGEIYIIKCLY